MFEIFEIEEDTWRQRQLNDEHGWYYDDLEDCYEEYGDDELGFFGIVAKRPNPPGCQFDKDGEYVPRSRRR